MALRNEEEILARFYQIIWISLKITLIGYNRKLFAKKLMPNTIQPGISNVIKE